MFKTFNDGKSFHIGCESTIYQHQANLLVKELDKNLDAKYLIQIETIEPTSTQDGFIINLGGIAANNGLAAHHDDVYTEELGQAVWEAGEDLFMDLHNLGDEHCSIEHFKPTSSSADDVEQAVNYYIKAHDYLGYACDFNEVEEHFECYEDDTINQRVQDYKPVYLFTKEETA